MKYNVRISQKIKEIVGLETSATDILIHEENLEKHMLKSRHQNMIKYIPDITDILNAPDYIGQNKNVKTESFEVIKVLADNVLVAVKLDKKNNYFFVASVYDVTNSKLNHMKRNGRIKPFDKMVDK
ncbi:PBECR2 nuclease fold domain-containing protein [Streptococcus sp. A23]|uniref:PBECR3 domain-containing polyvalent protein n=1 Tax=Streptococcus sp. A23 TaxID=3373127 RepID=UPI00374DA129